MAPSLDGFCECGSGLLYKDCCGLESLSPPQKSETDRVEAAWQSCEKACDRGDYKTAESGSLAILASVPCHVRALRTLYLAISKQDNKEQAVEIILRRIVGLQPNGDWAARELAMLLYQRREFSEAEVHARNAVRLAPGNPQAHNLMGMILTDTHKLQAGEFHYRKALELHAPVGKLCANLGVNLKNQGKIEESEKWYRQAMELEPDNMDSLMGWVNLLEVQGNLSGAWKLLASVKSSKSADDLGMCITRSVLYRRGNEYKKALAELDAANSDTVGKSAAYFYERGNVLDRMECYDDAFDAYAKANTIVLKSPKKRYAAKKSNQVATRLKGFFARHRLNILPHGVRSEEEKACPIFVVGFPRSGTTMVEQILTAHSKISAGDELPFIWGLTRIASKMLNSTLEYPDCLADLWFGDNQAALENFRDFYRKNARQVGAIEPGVPFFTDKMPLNETNLGFISLIYPEAPVIHLIRHPLDVVLSNYFNDLTHGNNQSYDLETSARHYVLIRGLVDHYLEQMDINYLAIRYEDVVLNAEEKGRELFKFIGIDWEEQCLDFHQNRRYARTASYAQVTEKLYMRSRYRYRNYQQHIERVLPILQPVITRLGYTVD